MFTLQCRKILESDTIVNATQCVLKQRYGTPGLQNSLLGSTGAFEVIGGRKKFVQVLTPMTTIG